MYGENYTKIMVYNMKMCLKRGALKKKVKKKVEEIQYQKEKLQILDYTILAKPRTIFVSSSYNYSSKPSTIVTSLLNSDYFFLSRSTNLFFGLVGPESNPILESKPKLILTTGM